MVDLNSTIITQMLGFLILLFILNAMLYKPVLRVIEQRRKTIDGIIKQADSLQLKAKENDNAYFSKLSDAENEAKREYNDILSVAAEEKEKLVSEEALKARKIIETHKRQIQESLDSEIKKSQQYSADISNKIYEQLVG